MYANYADIGDMYMYLILGLRLPFLTGALRRNTSSDVVGGEEGDRGMVGGAGDTAGRQN